MVFDQPLYTTLKMRRRIFGRYFRPEVEGHPGSAYLPALEQPEVQPDIMAPATSAYTYSVKRLDHLQGMILHLQTVVMKHLNADRVKKPAVRYKGITVEADYQ
jgi:hypothetical protein